MNINKFWVNAVIFSCVLLSGCVSMGLDSSVETSAPYKIQFPDPVASQWSRTSQSDANGYSVTYNRINSANTQQQSIKVNYGKNIQTSFADAIKEVNNTLSIANCQRHDMKILSQSKRSIMFEAVLDQCPTGNAMTSVYKVFNQPDGQYSIIYTANPHVVSSGIIQGMMKMVKSARVIRSN